MIKVEGHSNLYRDEKTGAIVNTDSMAYNQYVKSLDHRDSQKKELNEMKKDIEEIKLLLKNLAMNSHNINI
tara:strand:- start:1413 stop:1625 length:213 start_codon:yes stop_codon:yes gene_type:complete